MLQNTQLQTLSLVPHAAKVLIFLNKNIIKTEIEQNLDDKAIWIYTRNMDNRSNINTYKVSTKKSRGQQDT